MIITKYYHISINESENDVIYGQVWWPILGICALHLTHPKCTYTAVNTHTQQWTHTHSMGTHTRSSEHTHTAVNTHTHSSEHTHTAWTHTHSSEHTHTPWTHTRSSGQLFMLRRRGAVGGSVPCSRAPQSWYWGWRERWTFTRLRVRLSNHWATSHNFPLNVSLNYSFFQLLTH